MTKPKLLIFASGTATSGGSGFVKLVEASRNNNLFAEIVGVVSNYENGGVREKADKLGVKFIHFPKPWAGEIYQKIANESGADFFALSGWLKHVYGLDLETKFNSKTVFNIHPGPLPKFGGAGFHGQRVHEAVLESFDEGKIQETEINMHFVTPEYDSGPIFAKVKVPINLDDTPESLGMRVNMYEHIYQSRITNLVVNKMITWDGVNHSSLQIPLGYSIEQ